MTFIESLLTGKVIGGLAKWQWLYSFKQTKYIKNMVLFTRNEMRLPVAASRIEEKVFLAN